MRKNVDSRYSSGPPVIAESERLAERLIASGIACRVLNAKMISTKRGLSPKPVR